MTEVSIFLNPDLLRNRPQNDEQIAFVDVRTVNGAKKWDERSEHLIDHLFPPKPFSRAMSDKK